MSEERFDRMEQRFDRMNEALRQIGAQLANHDARFDSIGTQLARQDSRLETLDRHMHVLHEEAMGAIRGIAEHELVTRPEMDRRLAQMRETTDQRLDPLEAIVRRMNSSG